MSTFFEGNKHDDKSSVGKFMEKTSIIILKYNMLNTLCNISDKNIK